MNFIIYGLSEKGSSEIRYIGKSSWGLKRCNNYKYPSYRKRLSHLPVIRWLNKIFAAGSDYQIHILEETQPSQEELNLAEIRWIKKGRDEGWNLLNCTDGGDGTWGHRHTPEALAKIGAASKGNKYALGNRFRHRNRRTPEQCLICSRNKGGTPIEDQFGNRYETVAEAVRKLGLNQGNVSAVLAGKRNHTGGYRFKRVENAPR